MGQFQSILKNEKNAIAREIEEYNETFPLDKFRHEYSRVNEEIDEFLFYFFKSDFFRFKIMAESVKIRDESGELINTEINRKKPGKKK